MVRPRWAHRPAGSGLGELGVVVGAEGQGCGGDVFLQVRAGGGARDRHHVGRVSQQPGQGDLGRGSAELAGHCGQRPGGGGGCDGGDREPWDEGDAVLFAVAQDVFGGAVGEVVTVLDADDRGDGLGFGELTGTDFGQADVADLP